MNDFLDKFDREAAENAEFTRLAADEDVIENAANYMIGELVKRHSWLEFLRTTEIEDTLYTAPELR